MTDLLEETTRDFKEEQKVQLFRKLLPYIIAASAFIAILLWYNDWRGDQERNRIQKFGDEYLLPYAMGIESDVIPIGSDEEKAQDLLLLKKLEEFIRLGDNKGAIGYIYTILNKPQLNEVTKSFAYLNLINLLLDEEKITDTDGSMVQEIFKRYGSLKDSLNNNKPFALTIHMSKAMWLIKAGSLKEASSIISEILEQQNISDSVRMRAVALKNEIERLEHVR